MSKTLQAFLCLVSLCLAQFAFAADTDDAAQVARQIITALDNQQYELIYDATASKTLKDKMSKEVFLTNMTLGRASFGKLAESKELDKGVTESDPVSGYKGKIYTVDYLNRYANGSYYERVVMVREDDGQFRLAGLMGKPAPMEEKK